MPHFFAGDGLVGQQRLALCQVDLRARELQLARLDHRIILTGGRFLLANLPHRLRQGAGAAAQGGLRVDGIEPHQDLSGFDQLRVVGQHRNHGAGNLRRNHDPVAVDVGIVGALALFDSTSTQ